MKGLKKMLCCTILVVFTILMAFWLWVGNNCVEISQYDIEANIPASFDGFTIAQISDLHNAQLGKNNIEIIDKLKSVGADIIVMTGDMIDSRNTKIDVALDFAKEAVNIAPCYYVTGNHEARIKYFDGDYDLFRQNLINLGVTVLENESYEISTGEDTISIVGIQDTGFDFNTGADYLVSKALPKNDEYKILLAHRPEYFDLYEGADLIFSGHAHGGQVRLPFVGGLFAPGQGIFPVYDGGVYEEDGRVMVVSRGLGNSLFPFRINNKPEIVVVKLKK